MKSINDQKLLDYKPEYLIDELKLQRKEPESIYKHNQTEDDFDSETEGIEIVTIVFNSSIGDHHTIMSRLENTVIEIEVRDEYGQTYYNYKSEYNSTPKQEDIFKIIVEMKIYLSEELDIPYLIFIIRYNELKSMKEIKDFIKIYSDYYPDLNYLFENWLVENFAEISMIDLSDF